MKSRRFGLSSGSCIAGSVAEVMAGTAERGNGMDDDRLSERKKKILRAIVDAHITYGEPVGSKYLSEDPQITCSPATIRNEMAELEEMGYLEQPHTSAGRVPSELGYRFYVDSLIERYSATKHEIDDLNLNIKFKLTEMDHILDEASRLAASFTNYTGIAFKPKMPSVSVMKFEFVYLGERDFLMIMLFPGGTVKTKNIHLGFRVTPETVRRLTDAMNIYFTGVTENMITMPLIVKAEEYMETESAIVHPISKILYETMKEFDNSDLKVDGVNKLLQYPEYSDIGRLRDLIGMFEQKDKLLDAIEAHDNSDDEINVYIGSENAVDVMSNSTLVFKKIRKGNRIVGAVGVIGPKRMDYKKVISMIDRLASGIGDVVSEGDSLPPGKNDTK